jgi:hypothetical protein
MIFALRALSILVAESTFRIPWVLKQVTINGGDTFAEVYLLLDNTGLLNLVSSLP